MKCPNCGKKSFKGDKFCGYCGTNLKVVVEESMTVKTSKKNESKSALDDKPAITEGLPKDSKIIKMSSWKGYYRPSILIAIWWFAATLLFIITYWSFHFGSYVPEFLLMFILYMSVPSIWIKSKLKNRYQELRKEILIILLIWISLVLLNFILFLRPDFSPGFVIITSILAFFASLISLYLINRA